ncbi:MAG: DNA polymerase III subunit delta [Bacilli bacterium]
MGNIYLYTGEEKFRINTKIQTIVKETSADEYNIMTYDLDDANISDVIRDALTPPFMCDQKVVIVKNPRFLTSEKSLLEEQANDFLKYLSKPMETTVFIVNAVNLKLDERKEVVKRLKKVAQISDNNELTEVEFYGWVKRQCAINDVEIKDDATKTFYNLVGKSLMNAKNELDKLISYVGEKGLITVDVVNRVSVKEIQNDVFALANAIIDHNRSKVINLYRDLTKIGNDVNFLFGLVAKSMRELFIVSLMIKNGYKQQDVANSLNVSTGKAFYLVKNARSMDINTIENYVLKLGELDYKIKSGLMDAKTGFEFFLFEI